MKKKPVLNLVMMLTLNTCFSSNSADVRNVINHKCTKHDKRLTYSGCSYDKRTTILWCEATSFKRIPKSDSVANVATGDHACHSATELILTDSCVEKIEAGDFKSYKSLRRISCADNRLRKLNFSNFGGDLEHLDLSFNFLDQLHPFNKASKLLSLNLSSNSLQLHQLHTASVFRNLENLEELHLDENKIYRLGKYMFRDVANSLKKLTLTGNKISDIDEDAFYGLSLLEVLKLDGNEIEEVGESVFQHLINLKELTISYNKLKTIPTSVTIYLSNIETLNVGNNSIATLTSKELRNMSNLQNLSIHNNSIKSIESGVFAANRKLIYINLESNVLDYIADDSFLALCNLEYLLINHNRLLTPKANWFKHVVENSDGANFEPISDKNIWRCDCNVVPFFEFHKRVQILGTWTEKLTIKCDSIKEYKKKILDAAIVYDIKKAHPNSCEETPSLEKVTIRSLSAISAKASKPTISPLLRLITNANNCTKLSNTRSFELKGEYKPRPPQPVFLPQQTTQIALVTIQQNNSDLIIIIVCLTTTAIVGVAVGFLSFYIRQKCNTEKLNHRNRMPSNRTEEMNIPNEPTRSDSFSSQNSNSEDTSHHHYEVPFSEERTLASEIT